MSTRLAENFRSEPWRADEHEIHLFGVPIDRVTRAEAVDRVESWINQGDRARLIFTPDTTALMRAQHDVALMNAYREADLVTADGTGLLLASQIFGARLPERVAGIDLVSSLCDRLANQKRKVFLLGAKPGVAERAGAFLNSQYSGLKIVGMEHGYFEQNAEDELIERINGAAPHVLFVGMGVPYQEAWIMRNRQRLNVPVIMGVGGSFDVFAGDVDRAPKHWQNAGFEWLWRTIHEPWRVQRVSVIPLFLLQILAYRALSAILGSA